MNTFLKRADDTLPDAHLRVFGDWDLGESMGGGMPLTRISNIILEHILDNGHSTVDALARIVEKRVGKRERLVKIYNKSHKLDGDAYLLFVRDIVEIMREAQIVIFGGSGVRLHYHKNGGKFKLGELISTANNGHNLDIFVLSREKREQRNRMDRHRFSAAGLRSQKSSRAGQFLSAISMRVEPDPKQPNNCRCDCPKCGYTVRISQKWLSVEVPFCPVCTLSLLSEYFDRDGAEGNIRRPYGGGSRKLSDLPVMEREEAKNEINRLYFEEGLKVAAIAKRTGYSSQGIRRVVEKEIHKREGAKEARENVVTAFRQSSRLLPVENH